MTTNYRKPWRQDIELSQNYSRHKMFTVSTTNNDKVDISISDSMEEANKVSLIVENADAYLAFDKDATADATCMLLPANEGYFDDAIWVANKISFIRIPDGTNARIRGIIWGR